MKHTHTHTHSNGRVLYVLYFASKKKKNFFCWLFGVWLVCTNIFETTASSLSTSPLDGCPEDGGSMFCRNGGTLLSNHTAA